MIKTRPEQALDQEWVILMNIAKEMGLNKEEVRSFLQRNKNLPPVSIPKRRAIDR
ncbi:anti-repressor SinI family protein [Alkalihalobacillus sp. R86527]|uniref:anti-repressor SinI family protein n=1 Tax=Alkalihalobacillus sp. R86527 TaxID=3093863 RepID=UPI00366C4B6F